jgi:hypothetical protein
MCCFYRAFDSRFVATASSIIPAAAAAAAVAAGTTTAMEHDLVDFTDGILADVQGQWPLEKPPEFFWQQGEQFSDLLSSMIRMRDVPPKWEPVSHNGQMMLVARADEDPVVKDFLQNVCLSLEALKAARERPLEPDDGDWWELKWASKLFVSF